MKSSFIALAGAVAMISGGGLCRADDAHKMQMSRYGGPVYVGAPALTVTASLVAAGGGADFSAARALTSMVGDKVAGKELSKLTKQFGKARVGSFVEVFDFAVKDALRIATEAGVTLPDATLSGPNLAAALLTAGLDKDGTFYAEYLLDKAVSHTIHMKVMDDIDAKQGQDADLNYHVVLDQLMVDLAKAYRVKGVRLAKLRHA